MIYRLIILNGDRRGDHITVTEESMTIGCGQACDVRIIDPEMAQTHAEITHRPNGPVINDLGSMNRILVNNQEVRQATLKHGDLVELGRTRFLLQAYVQAEVTAGAALESAWRRWGWTAGAAAVVLLAILSPVMCRHYRKTAPAVAPPSRAETHRVAARLPAYPVKPPAAREAATVVSKAVPVLPLSTAVVVSAFAPAENATLAEQERELESAGDALAESKARMMLVDAKDRLGAGDVDGAERVLVEVLWLRPDYTPALELRARLLERRGRAVEARKQWSALTTATNVALATQAWAEVRRIDAESAPAQESPPALESTSAPPAKVLEPAPAPKVIADPASVPAASVPRVRIGLVETSRFPGNEAFRETRLLSIHLAAATTNVLPDAGAVTVGVLFHERDSATGAVTPAPERGPREPLPVEGSWREGEDKVVSASYAVPASEPADRVRQFHGYVVRVFHHGTLQGATAKPLDLLAAPGGESPPPGSGEPIRVGVP